jgi:Transposase IS4
LYVAVDHETMIPFNLNVCDDQFNESNCQEIEGGQPGKQVTRLLEHLPGQGYVAYTDNWYTSVGLARVLKRMDQKISLVGTVRKERILDAISHVALGNPNKKTGKLAKSKRPSKDTPKGALKSCCTVDGEVHVSGIMDTAAVYLVDSHYGSDDKVVMFRKSKGQTLAAELVLPHAFQKYNDKMGGVDNIDSLRLGDHGTEGRGRAMKWTSRLHDGLHNIGRVASYSVYKYCRKKKWGHKKVLNHSQFNERLIIKYLYNDAWAAEKAIQNSGRRSSVRSALKQRKPQLYPEDNLVEYHDLLEETALNTSGRKVRKTCVECPAPEPGTRDHSRLTSYYCKQCSESAPNKVYMCPTCFGAYHNKKNQERGHPFGAAARKLVFK